ncbi:uncharacterized protein LOC124301264 isoform X2 [Neodiprion virginianus]|uniref:uncharacterized protein LOC124301264 isoform X2 n=1 Tax=Neodiprion virginianus TaxID=2961670 RepID=UPI001EE6C963|nr:uncharacterized protein LOC124301264 isoform X2 [Neodiprion virginianus]
MSLNSEREAYGNMIEVGMDHKEKFLECQNSSDYLLLSNDEKTIEESMIEEHFEVVEQVKTELEEPPVYFQEALETCEEVTVDYNDSSVSVPLSPPMSPRSPHARLKTNEQWTTANDEDKLSMHLDCENDKRYYVEEREEVHDVMDEDEETIATFITAAGQQLALYAVEDSEDVFAVAVYDESGEPPTNFQFLMKSDVERLIGEGAVRTVKKPSQIKRQLLTTQSPVFTPRQQRIQHTSSNDESMTEVKFRQQKALQRACNNNAVINENCQTVLDSNRLTENYSSKEPNNVTYLMMNDTPMSVGKSGGSQESLASESEIVEQSTVQYILLEGDQSDSELTFDEIQATLQGFNLSKNGNKSVKKKIFGRKTVVNQRSEIQHVDNTNDIIKSETQPIFNSIENCLNTSNYNTPSIEPQIETRVSENFGAVDEVDSSAPRSVKSDTPKLGPDVKENATDKLSENISTAFVDPKINSNGIDGNQQSMSTLEPNVPKQNIEIQPRIKRPRKQQLTSVNRGDSEIIIQPALIGAEEENNNKKRGRRKKKPAPDPDYNPRPIRLKKSKKAARNPKVEIIEIDIDEEHSLSQAKNDVIEITIDDGKEKGSSDKENEIIMVRDSDDESHDTQTKPIPPAMQCVHCSRNFRQKRALDTHSRVCPKLRTKLNKANIRTLEKSDSLSKDESGVKQVVHKEYTCKVCQEKFNAVVVLARHTRMEHPKAYRNKSSKASAEVKSVEKPIDTIKETIDKRRVTRVSQKKKIQSSNQTWRSKKLNCDDCGRWFPSTAILAAHCLQHATKNSEKQIRQCHICKKLIKTRLLYIQHMKTHIKSTRNTKPPATVLQKKLRQPRQVTSKLTPVKKRGRPRKF